jgi:predicted MFS family arabinose efflux permease
MGQLAGVCVALILYGLSPNLVWATVALTIVGAFYIGVLSGLSTVVQLQAPAEFRGRILSLYTVALGVLYPIGSLAQGPIADAIGLPATTVAAAVLLLGALAFVALARPAVVASLQGDTPAAVV